MTKDFKFTGSQTSPIPPSYTTPHYYPKYEIWSIEETNCGTIPLTFGFNQMFEKMKGVEFSKSSFAVHCKVQPLLDPILYFVFIRRSPSPSPNEIHILI